MITNIRRIFIKIKSVFITAHIFIDKLIDTVYRSFMGLPNLERSKITASLFLGSQYNLIGLEKLKRIGITAIVNMRIHNVYNSATHKGVRYLHLPTMDNKPTSILNLIKGIHFIENEITLGGKVYVHCRQGLGRGPSMVIAYLIFKGNIFDDAFRLVKNVRPFINPRQSQVARLRELEIYLASEQAKFAE
jgi:protein-tyrosine phosphatase